MREWITIVEAMGLELNGYARCVKRTDDEGLTLIIESDGLANFMYERVGQVFINDIQTFQEGPNDRWRVTKTTGHQIYVDPEGADLFGLKEGDEVLWKASPNVLRFYTT